MIMTTGIMSKRRAEELFVALSPLKKEGDKGVMLINQGIYEYGYFNACFLHNMMSLMVYALSKGYTPHIDLKDRGKGWTNWSTFFEQPLNTDSGTKPDIVCDVQQGHYFPRFNTPYHKIDLRLWCKVYHRLVRLNDCTRSYVEDEYHRLMAPLREHNHVGILGAICRGTDYVKLKPKGHPVQPPVELVIEKAGLLMRQYRLEYVYLATEEAAIQDRFEAAFPGKIIVNNRTYYDEIFRKNNLEHIYQVEFDRENDIYLKGLEYLSSLQLLSRCDVLVGGNCGGANAALFMNNMKYKHVDLFDLGLY